jgi:hypothetical protein
MNIPVQPAGSVDQFIETAQSNEASSGAYLLESLEQKLDYFEQQLLELNKYSSKLTEEYTHKVYLLHFDVDLLFLTILGINFFCKLLFSVTDLAIFQFLIL